VLLVVAVVLLALELPLAWLAAERLSGPGTEHALASRAPVGASRPADPAP